MEINNLEKNKNIELKNNIINEQEQRDFLETTLGKTINTAVDIGIRTILPDFIEDQVINLKDNLLNYGLKEGIQKTVSDTIDLGKSAIGILTGNFDSISQMQNAIQAGGLIDGMSSLLDTVVDKVNQTGLINNNLANTIKQGKDIILNNVESNIEKTFAQQLESMDNLENYINAWKEDFEKKDFNAMEKSYNKLEKELKNLVPIDNIINQAKIIENLHKLIKNNGQNFKLTAEEIELSNKLI